MKTCIICREEKEIFSDEHVIPDSLGGYYHIYNVCKQCNSNLGTFVDCKLTNHKFSEFQRYILGLRGKSKNLPNPFSGTHHIEGDKRYPIQLRLGADGKPTPYIRPSVSYENMPDEGGGKIINIMLDASDKNKLDEILDKISKRLQIPPDNFKGIDRTVQSIERPRITGGFNIDLEKFKIGLLKIAYEFAVDTVPEYFDDKDAISISQILRNADYPSVGKYANIGSGFDHSIFASLTNYFDLESKKHYLVLTSSKHGGLTCLIHLHKIFSIGISLSTEKYPDDLLAIGINDIELKTFRKVTGTDLDNLIYSPPTLRFKYHFKNEKSRQDFLDAEQRNDFSILTTPERIPVFDCKGSQLQEGLYGKMKEVQNEAISEPLEGGGIANTYNLRGDVFIKILPSNKLVHILAVREERQQKAKL